MYSEILWLFFLSSGASVVFLEMLAAPAGSQR